VAKGRPDKVSCAVTPTAHPGDDDRAISRRASFAEIEPVQPRPTMTTSFGGSFRAITLMPVVRALRARPVCVPTDVDGRVRVAFVVAPDPVAVVVARSGKADHPPGAHVAVAAVDRIRRRTSAACLSNNCSKNFLASMPSSLRVVLGLSVVLDQQLLWSPAAACGASQGPRTV
jgi:hypothetical protein